MTYDYERTAAIGPTPANRAAQTMGWPVKLMERAQKSLYNEDTRAALDQLATAMAHFTSVLAELELDTDHAHALNQQLRADSRSVTRQASDKTAGFYDSSMQKLVMVVDRVTAGTKYLQLAKRICDDIETQTSVDVAGNRAKLYGAHQATEFVRSAIKDVERAVQNLEDHYDYLNSWLLEQKMR